MQAHAVTLLLLASLAGQQALPKEANLPPIHENPITPVARDQRGAVQKLTPKVSAIL